MADVATVTKRVADTRDLEMFSCMGPHIQSTVTIFSAFPTLYQRARGTAGWRGVIRRDKHSRIPAGGGYEGMEDDGHKCCEAGDSAQCNEKSGIFFLLLALSYCDKS